MPNETEAPAKNRQCSAQTLYQIGEDMPSSEEIASHPLLKQLLDDFRHVIERIDPVLKSQRRSLRVKHPVDVSPSEHYTWQAFGKASAIYDTACRLEYAKEFVAVFPSPKGFEKNESPEISG